MKPIRWSSLATKLLLYCASATAARGQDLLLPPEGRLAQAIDTNVRSHIDPSRRGISSTQPADGGIELRADLDWRDPIRRSGALWIDLPETRAFSSEASDGVFVTLRCQIKPEPPGTASAAPAPAPAAFRACTGLRDADGNVFWGRGFPVLPDGASTTAGFYPELRFPLPQGFRSQRFDPDRISSVGVRLDVIDDKRRNFNGIVRIDALRSVAMPDELRSSRRRIAERIGREIWLTSLKPRPASSAPAAVPIAAFCENSGVNYPWPAGFYAGVGRRPWSPDQPGFSACAAKIAEDFAYLDQHRVRLVRVFLFCDARTGIVASERGMQLDPFALDDIRALLCAAEKFPALRLAPVLFDFLIGDGVQTEDGNLVGEHVDWIVDPDRRQALLNGLQPAIDLLCDHPQVAFVDLINEPEHAAAVDADAMWLFVRDLAERVHRHPRRMVCTVGSANAIYAPFWLSAGIDFATCHWFGKTDATHPLGDHSDALPVATAIMTEIDPSVGVDAALTKLWQSGFRGGLFWSLNADDAYEFRGPPAEAFKHWVDQRIR